jgi:putative transposase
VINYAIKAYAIGIKKACTLFNLSRSMYYQRPKKGADDEIKRVLLQLAEKHIRWGFDKMRAAIKRDGYVWNHKRIRRVYCELELNLRTKPKKRLPAREKQTLLQPIKPNYCWSVDYMSDALSSGQKFRTFNIIDDFNRQGLGVFVGQSMPTNCITRHLDFVAEFSGYPQIIRTDNGPEFISKKFLLWAKKHRIEIKHIQRGKPAQNGFIERFNRTYRNDVLDINLFSSVHEVQTITDRWLHEYNHERPHESLGNKTPIEFLRSLEGMPSRERPGADAQHRQNTEYYSTLKLS